MIPHGNPLYTLSESKKVKTPSHFVFVERGGKQVFLTSFFMGCLHCLENNLITALTRYKKGFWEFKNFWYDRKSDI